MEQRLIKRARRRDRIARWIITGGGVLIIVCVVGILFLIAGVAAPLFFSPSATLHSQFRLPFQVSPHQVLAIGTDEYLETSFLITSKGSIIFLDSARGNIIKEIILLPPGSGSASVRSVELSGNLNYGITWQNGWVSLEKLSFVPQFDADGRRSISARVERLANLPPTAGRQPPLVAQLRFDEEIGATAVRLLPGNILEVTREAISEGIFGESEPEISHFRINTRMPGEISALALDDNGSNLYAGTKNGHLLWWDLTETGEALLKDRLTAFTDQRAITVLSMALGNTTLAVGDEKGGVSAWFPVAKTIEAEFKSLRKIHLMKGHQTPVKQILSSRKTRSLVSMGQGGVVHFDHITNQRHLMEIAAEPPLTRIGLSTRFNGLIGLDDSGSIAIWETEIPHPEAGLKAFFGKLWYESYPSPEYVWQSSGGSDDYEPKLSLMPLVFGTLKGTIFGMLFAIPLAIFGAIYTSHLMQPGLRNVIKPAVEIMGSMPSVVIGFLAALWLAPIIKTSLVAVFLMIGLFPVVVAVTLLLWGALSTRPPFNKISRGFEFIFLVPTMILSVYVSFKIGGGIEKIFFGGDLPLWLFQKLGVQFDQRNSIVIAFALGFAVVPIIFTIADDALVNVPRNLTAASLALGASRWQTIWRVVLPSASPGIFAGVMIGFGRAVGETMIVLMATGNTPIMDWNIFNGMRTLAANIAVEIPEAPVDGTLYRTLFLSAVLLFLVTFLINSMAEFIRQKLRGKYGQY